MIVKIVRRDWKIPPRIELLDAAKKSSIYSHQIRKFTVFGALLLDVHVIVPFDDPGTNFTGIAVEQDFPIDIAAQDCRPHLFDATGAERVRFTGKTELWKRPFLLLQHRSRRPWLASKREAGRATRLHSLLAIELCSSTGYPAPTSTEV